MLIWLATHQDRGNQQLSLSRLWKTQILEGGSPPNKLDKQQVTPPPQGEIFLIRRRTLEFLLQVITNHTPENHTETTRTHNVLQVITNDTPENHRHFANQRLPNLKSSNYVDHTPANHRTLAKQRVQNVKRPAPAPRLQVSGFQIRANRSLEAIAKDNASNEAIRFRSDRIVPLLGDVHPFSPEPFSIKGHL